MTASPALGGQQEGSMGTGFTEQEFHEELQELLAAARGMAEGNFYQTVNVRARGMIGELAVYINKTLRNLQTLDPTVKGTSREIPKVAQHLTEIIQTTEDATNRVLEQAEHLVEEQAKVEQGLSRATEMLHHVPSVPTLQGCLKILEEVKTIQRQSQGRAMDIMSAMEFQDLTTQKIQKLIALVAEVESRLLQVLVMFRIEGAAAGGEAKDPILETCAKDEGALCDQDLVDQLLRGFQADRG
ncbi:MAG TPA: protein phosphatase CheZ [Candidatus Acidoferrum sp.]|nr:protein phosphatase CheZ [Candidatus Acidoferrum sp.]